MRARNLLTMVGGIVVPRRYFACSCGQCGSPMDVWAGIGSRTVSEHVRRVVAVAGGAWSFDQASAKLRELCRLKISDETVRAICDEEGERAGRWMKRDERIAVSLAQAPGELEFSVDGTSVNTVNGWREIRLSVLCRRESGVAAEPGQWDDRVLPVPSFRLAWSGIAGCERIGAGWSRAFARLGVRKDEPLSVIADGAKWIWEQAAKRLPGGDNTQWCVDVYHVSEHLHACGKAMFGQEDARARRWADEQLEHLLDVGGVAFIKRLDGTIESEACQPRRDAMRKLRNYLDEHRDSMWYRQRLAAGRPIGSGLIEGGCKNVLGSRLKLNSARWRVRRAERMAHLRCLDYSGLWDVYWDKRVA